jgi:hypothetical protein
VAEITHDFRVDVTAALPPEVAGDLSGKPGGQSHPAWSERPVARSSLERRWRRAACVLYDLLGKGQGNRQGLVDTAH